MVYTSSSKIRKNPAIIAYYLATPHGLPIHNQICVLKHVGNLHLILVITLILFSYCSQWSCDLVWLKRTKALRPAFLPQNPSSGRFRKEEVKKFFIGFHRLQDFLQAQNTKWPVTLPCGIPISFSTLLSLSISPGYLLKVNSSKWLLQKLHLLCLLWGIFKYTDQTVSKSSHSLSCICRSFTAATGAPLQISQGYGYTALIFILHPHRLKEQINV